MSKITFKGNTVTTFGELPPISKKSPDFKLVRSDLSEVTLENYKGKRKVLNIFPSIDTAVCAKSVRRFNEEAAKLKNTVVLNISKDLPFAQTRFCSTEGIANCETLSCFQSPFGKDYGLIMMDSVLAGLLARAVLVLGEDNTILYSELVPEITNEPNYDAALKALA